MVEISRKEGQNEGMHMAESILKSHGIADEVLQLLRTSALSEDDHASQIDSSQAQVQASQAQTLSFFKRNQNQKAI